MEKETNKNNKRLEDGEKVKRKQSKEDLYKQLEEQVNFIKISAEIYDHGYSKEAKRIAQAIRILVHNTERSYSLLKQLNILNNAKFVDTSMERIKDNIITTWAGLTLIQGNKHIPILDNNINSAKKINFEKWWNGVVIVDSASNEFTRKKLVLYVANQDGGAHVDPKLDEIYASLSRDNSLEQKYSRDGTTFEDFEDTHLATIRQIGHEILKTLCSNYTCSNYSNRKGFTFGNITLIGKKTDKSNNQK